MEAEIQRRKEHKNDATNFEKARGFVRTCWKTKNWDITRDPTQDDSSEDSEDEQNDIDIENRDRVDNTFMSSSVHNMTPNNRTKSIQSSEGRDRNFDRSVGMGDLNQSFDRSRLMTESKSMRKLRGGRPQIINIEEVQDEHSAALSTQDQIDTLQAIKDFNKSIPLRRRAKDSLPEIHTYNVAKIHRVKKDYKKDKTELESIYKPIGITDEGIPTQFNKDPNSLAAKTRAIQRSQSLKRISYLRTSYANLLGSTPEKAESESGGLTK